MNRQDRKIFFHLPMFLLCVGTIIFSSCAEKEITSNYNIERAEYLIGPEDILHVEIWKEPDLTRDVTVQPDGKISLPLVNEVRVAGLSIREIQKLLEKKYAKFIEIPSVNINVVDPRSYKIYVVGNINTPGMLQPKSEITFLQAIAMAGGFTEWAKKKDILVKRYEQGIEKTIKINYNKIISGDHPELNIIMKTGDTIIVP